MTVAAGSLADLPERDRERAWSRWQAIRPAVEDGVPLTRAAAEAEVPVPTARRWLSAYRAEGLVGLVRRPRSDRGQRRTHPELVSVIEAMALSKPSPSAATIARRARRLAEDRGWPAPAYSTVAAIVAALDPALMTLAHDGPEAFRDRFELVYRRRADRPNEIWQADHTELDVLVLDADGQPRRPWLTLILDDCSRAIAGYSVFLGAPSALNLSLALRQAIWRKTDPAWVVYGLPEILHVDHGSDFTSHHIAQVAADLHIRLIHSAIARPQGRGKVERLFGTITSELLPELPGHLVAGVQASPPTLTLPELDDRIRRWMLETYHHRAHSETRQSPHRAWLADGWLPHSPDSLEALDLLLVMVATPRRVHRDGIRFQGLRYLDPVLAGYVGREVTIRYDPRDITEIRVFLGDRFLCRAISAEHPGEPISLKDVQAARVAHRRALRARLNHANRTIGEYLPRRPAQTNDPPAPTPPREAEVRPAPRRRLSVYYEDLDRP